MAQPILTHECICGAGIRGIDITTARDAESVALWVDGNGGSFCYPNDPNPVDALVRHEPCDELEGN